MFNKYIYYNGSSSIFHVDILQDDPSFSMNIVIWNTIQLLFPKELEAMKV